MVMPPDPQLSELVEKANAAGETRFYFRRGSRIYMAYKWNENDSIVWVYELTDMGLAFNDAFEYQDGYQEVFTQQQITERIGGYEAARQQAEAQIADQ
jgi:hypothetical protein